MDGRIAVSVFFGLAFLHPADGLWANPQHPTVMSGQAILEQNGQALHITTADKTVIHWDQFSIDAGELTRFIQPGVNSAVLNRVVGENLSAIYGTLESNGRVFLINPYGIVIGKEGLINTASFIGSTLDLKDSDFLQGKDLFFSGASGASVINLGRIEASNGDAILIGYRVDNQGELLAPQGTAGMAAGSEVVLKLEGKERVAIRPKLQPCEQQGMGVENSGLVAGLQAELKADGNPYALAINHTGKIQATAIGEKDGEIYLFADGGTTGVSGEVRASGGDIHILGDYVCLYDDALIDSSGELGGGEILIGGGFQGSDPLIPNASTLFAGEGVRIDSSAKEKGDAGRVVAWADGLTVFAGEVAALGGKEGGDGGFVEISGKQTLSYTGSANRLAPMGKAGTLLLDPTSVWISTAANTVTNTTAAASGGTGAAPIFARPLTVDFANNYLDTTLEADLAAGDVIIQTSSSDLGSGAVQGIGNGEIRWLDDATIAPAGGTANKLTLLAAGDVFINGSYTNILGGGFSIVAAGNVTFEAQATTVATASPSVVLTTGAIDITAKNITLQGSFGAVLPTNLTTTSGAIKLVAQQGDIVLSGGSGAVSDAVITTSSGTISLSTNAGSLKMISDTTLATVSTTGGGNIVIDTHQGDVFLKGGGAGINTTISSLGGDVTLDINNGSLIQLGGFAAASMANITAAGGNIDVNITDGNCRLSGQSGSVTMSTSPGPGFLTLATNNGTIVLSEASSLATTSGALTVNATQGNVSLTSSATGTSSFTTMTGSLSVTANGGSISLTADTSTAELSSTAGGSITATTFNGGFSLVSAVGAGGIARVGTTLAPGAININTTGGDVSIIGGPAPAVLTTVGSTGDINVFAKGGNIFVNSATVGTSSVTSGGGVNFNSNGGSITLQSGGAPTFLTAAANGMNLTAINGGISLLGTLGFAVISMPAAAPLTLNTTNGDLRCIAGAGAAFITNGGGSGDINIFTKNGNFVMQGSPASAATISSLGTGNIRVQTDGGNIDLISSAFEAVITSTSTGNIDITLNNGNLSLYGGASIIPQISTTLGGDIGIHTVNGNCLLNGLNGLARIDTSASTGNITVATNNGGIGLTGTSSFFTSTGAILASSTQGDISLSDASFFTSTGGRMIVTADGGNILLQPDAAMVFLSNTTGPIQLTTFNGGVSLLGFLGTANITTTTGPININTTNGDVLLRGNPGNVTIETDTAAVGQGGDIAIFTKNGDIVLDAAGSSAAGVGVRIRTLGISSQINLRTDTGDVVMIAGENLARLETVSGPIILGLNGGDLFVTNVATTILPGVFLPAISSTTAGDVDIRIVDGSCILTGGGQIGMQGASTGAITVTTTNGDIALSFAAAIRTISGNINLTASGGNISLTSLFPGIGLPTITSTGCLAINLTTHDGSVMVSSLSGGSPIISNPGLALNITTINGDISLLAGAGSASLLASGPMYLDATNGNVELTSEMGTTSISTTTRDVNIFTHGGSILLNGGTISSAAIGSATSMNLMADGGEISLISPGAPVSVTTAAGPLNATTYNGGITLLGTGGSASMTATAGSINLNATSGDVTLTAGAGAVSLTTAGSGDVNLVSKEGNIFLNSSATSAASISSAGGVDLNSNGGSIAMESGGAMAFITGAAPNPISFTSFQGSISILGTLGQAIVGSGGSPITLNATSGDINIVAGAGAMSTSIFSAGAGGTIGLFTKEGDIFLRGSATTDALVSSLAGAPIKVEASGGNVNLISNAFPATIANTTGNIDIAVTSGDLLLFGGTSILPQISTIGGGNINVDIIDGSCLLNGTTGPAQIATNTSTGNIDITTRNGDVALSGISALLTSTGNLTVSSAQGDISLSASGGLGSSMAATGGTIVLTADGGSIALTGNLSLASITNTTGPIRATTFNGGISLFGSMGASTITTTSGPIDLNATGGDISLIGGAGFCTITTTAAGGDIQLLTKQGNILFTTSATADARVTTGAGTGTDVTVIANGGDIRLNAKLGSAARIAADNFTTVNALGGNLDLIGGAAAGGVAEIFGPGGVDIRTGYDCNLLAGGVGAASATISSTGGIATLDIGGNCTLIADASPALINGFSGVNLSTGSDLILQGGGGGAATATITITTGAMSFTVGGDLHMLGGTGGASFAQIGTSAGSFFLPMNFSSVGGDLLLRKGSGPGSYVQIGHISTGPPIACDIVFGPIGGDVALSEPPGASGAGSYAKIGHTSNVVTTITGDVLLTDVQGALELSGGIGVGSTATSASIGHGTTADAAGTTYAGTISVHAGNIRLTGGPTIGTSATIGFDLPGGAGSSFQSPAVEAISQRGITMTGSPISFAVPGNVTIGCNAPGTASSFIGAVNVVANGGNVALIGGTNCIVLIGTLGSAPNTVSSNINVTTPFDVILTVPLTIGGNLAMIGNDFITGTGTNLVTINAANLNVDGGNAMAGSGASIVYSNGELDINLSGAINLNAPVPYPATVLTGTARLAAFHDVTINPSASSPGAITLIAPDSSANITSIDSLAGAVYIGTPATPGAASISLSATLVSAGNAQIAAPGTTGDIFLNVLRDITLARTGGGIGFPEINANRDATLIAGGNITLSTTTVAVPQVVATTGTLKIASAQTISLAQSSRFAVLGPTGGDLRVGADVNILMSDTSSFTNFGLGDLRVAAGTDLRMSGTASIAAPGGGDIFITVGGGDLVLSGMDTITASGTGNLTIDAISNLSLVAGSVISVTGTGDLLVNVGTDISLSGGLITTASGDIIGTAGRDLTMTGGEIRVAGGSGNLRMLAHRNVNMSGGAILRNLGSGEIYSIADFTMSLSGGAQVLTTGGALHLVVDNLFPDPPKYGTGRLLATAGTIINAGGGFIRIYTARQPFNIIGSTLNTFIFVPGVQYTNTSQEIWDSYFNRSLEGSPFTIFYKDAPLTVIPVPPVPPVPGGGGGIPGVASFPFLFLGAISEAQQDWRVYDEFDFSPVSFVFCSKSKESANSCQVKAEKTKKMLRPAYRNYNLKKIDTLY